jgi:BirA family biotin operon repressor/biotin-[acetyl-CoA-carboxylase] ligase
MLISVLLRPELDPADLFFVTMIAGLALRSAVQSAYGLETTIKWPNDLLVGDKKLSGVLAHSQFDEFGRRVVVVGAGLNVRWSEDELKRLDRPATSIAVCLGRPVDEIHPLITRYLEELWTRYRFCVTEDGRRSSLAEYRAACSTLGRNVEVCYPHSSRVGRAIDVNDYGELIVAYEGEVVAVNAADVVHLRLEP